MVLAANAVAMRIEGLSPGMYVLLLVSVLALYLVPNDQILAWPLPARLIWALTAVPLPIFFAGLIFSTTFRGVRDIASLLGANLIGATAGGFCEYISMASGTRALTLLVLAAYGASFLCQRARGSEQGNAGSPTPAQSGEIRSRKGRPKR